VVQHLTMSRGLGRIQRRILDVLRLEAGKPIATTLLTIFVFMDDENLAKFRSFDRDIQYLSLSTRRVDQWKRNTVSRACNRLWREGRIQAYDIKGTAWWEITPEKLQRKKKRN
jgi:hypothetical protein